MLQKMHERMQGIVMTLIIVAICAAFALWGIQYYLRSYGDTNVVAKIDGVKIARQYFESAFQRARQAMISQKGKNFIMTQQAQIKLRQQVLKQLTDSWAFYLQATKIGYIIGPQQTDIALQQIPAFQDNGHFSRTKFAMILSRMLFSEAEFIQGMQRSIINNQLQMGIIGSSFILPHELQRTVALIKQQRDINYSIIPVQKFLGKVNITPQLVQQFYNNNKDKFTVPAKMKLDYVVLDAKNLKLHKSLTLQQVQQYYDDNISMYTQPEKWQISYVMVPILPTSSSKEFAQARSKALGLAKSNHFSKADWVTAAEIDHNLLSELQKLQPGVTSAPFKTSNGIYIVKVLQREPTKTLPFSAVKTKAKKALRYQLLTAKFDKQSGELSNITYTSSNSLASVEKQLGLHVITTGWITAKGGKTGITANPMVVQAAFGDTVLKQRYNSDPIQLASDKVAVIRVNKYQPAKTMSLATVRPQIITGLRLQAANKLVKKFANSLITKISAGVSFAKVVAVNNLAIKTVRKLARDNKTLPPALVAAAFTVTPVPPHKVAVTDVTLANGDAAVIVVNKLYPGDITTLPKKAQQIFRQQLVLSEGGRNFAIYRNKLIAKAKVKIIKH